MIGKYLNSKEITSLADTTRLSYINALRHLEEFATGKVDPTFQGMQGHMADLADFLEKKGLSGQSVQQYLAAIKIFLRWTGNPVDYTYRISNEERKANQVKHMERWFDENDIARCLAYEFPMYPPIEALRYRILIRILTETAARIGETAAVTVDNIDLEDMAIWINASKTIPRPVFFSPKTRSMLEQLKKKSKWTGTLFPDTGNLKRVITDMLIELGMKNGKDGRGPHTFRHYCITKLFYSGVRIEDIAMLAGDKVDTIRQRYIHPTALQLREEIRKGMGWEF